MNQNNLDTEVNSLDSSLFLQACYGNRQLSKTPMWLMRQAGRYLPEYLEIRKKHSTLEMFCTPEIASTITMQPIERYSFDASIIYADILTPLMSLGVSLDFVEGTGPVIYNPIIQASDVDNFSYQNKKAAEFTIEAIKLTKAKLNPLNIPLIGFIGGPFTLSSYLIDTKGLHDKGHAAKKFIYENPVKWHELQKNLTAMLIDYILDQIKAGVNAIQIFESWLGVLSPQDYSEFVEPYLQEIIATIRAKTNSQIPIIFFATSITGLFPLVKNLNANVYGVDWRCSLDTAASLLKENDENKKLVLQGNLDPIKILNSAETGATDLFWKKEVEACIKEGRNNANIAAHIFNLGHGIQPKTSPKTVEKLVSFVRSL